MLRLTILSRTSGEVVLKVEGWVEGAEVKILAEEIVRRRNQNQRLVLDLEKLKGIDPAGLDLLAGWIGRGVQLRGGSRYIGELLKRHGLV